GSDVNQVVIEGGSGGNSFQISGTPARVDGSSGGPPIQLNCGSGADSIVVAGNSGVLAIDGQGGADSITVDFGFGGIHADVLVDGGSGLDTLAVQGSGPGDSFTVTGTVITHGATTLNYLNSESLG